MKREIKFRGLTGNNNWVFGYYYVDDTHEVHVIKDLNFKVEYTIKPETRGQFTGLKDKNGKEIYEGDIVKVQRNPDYFPETFPIEYKKIGNCGDCINEDGIGFDFKLHVNELEYLEVIGNIYENPELLKELKKKEKEDEN